MTDPSPARRPRLLGLGVLVITFVVGALAGAAVARVLWADEPPADARAVEPRGRHADQALFERLGLTPDQKTRVDSILERRRVQMTAFWDQHRPELRAIVDSTRTEVRAVLTDAQRAEEEKLWAERRAAREKKYD